MIGIPFAPPKNCPAPGSRSQKTNNSKRIEYQYQDQEEKMHSNNDSAHKVKSFWKIIVTTACSASVTSLATSSSRETFLKPHSSFFSAWPSSIDLVNQYKQSLVPLDSFARSTDVDWTREVIRVAVVGRQGPTPPATNHREYPLPFPPFSQNTRIVPMTTYLSYTVQCTRINIIHYTGFI